jgi:hypothetical protein
VGHFLTPVGYEGVPAPNSSFYSKSYSCQFAGLFAHWGGMLNWKTNDASPSTWPGKDVSTSHLRAREMVVSHAALLVALLIAPKAPHPLRRLLDFSCRKR